MVTQTENKQINMSALKRLLSLLREERYKENSERTFNPDLMWGRTARAQDLPVIKPVVSTRDHKSRRVPSKYQISTNTAPLTLGFHPHFLLPAF